MTYERPNIASMQGYSPGEQPDDAAVIKLNTNENPYPPGPAVATALAASEVAELRRYPPPLATEFRRAAARLHGLGPDNVIATNGGDELLRLVLTTFTDAGDRIVVTRPTYSLYPVLAEIQGCELEQIELNDDWSVPENFARQLQDSDAKLCLLVNPHAPSGRLLDAVYLDRLAAAFPGVLLIDEAYVDFVDPALGYSAIPLLARHDNVLILRSMSKGYSLAGLRFGYGLGPESLIAPMLYKTRDSYNLDLLAQRLATAALQDQDYASSTWARVRASREYLRSELAAMSIDSLPSQTNFLLCTITSGKAMELAAALKSRGILVRYFDQDRLRDKLRISIGTEEENQALISALTELL